MNTFLRAIGVVSAVFVMHEAADALKLPTSGDCRVMRASDDGEVWQGRFSGSYEDLFHTRRLIAVKGCFRSEYECRRWINEVQTAVTNPGLMTCRRVLPK